MLKKYAHVEGKQLKKRSGIYSLDLHLDKDRLKWVGGRLNKKIKSSFQWHPPYFYWQQKGNNNPGKGSPKRKVTDFWVVKSNTLVRSLVGKCVKCCLLREQLWEQSLVDLPTGLLMDHHLQIVELIYFGPFW